MMLEKDILNIYCDASMTEIDGTSYGCPGAIAVWYDGNNTAQIIQDTSLVLFDSTNNQSEIYAILLAVSIAITYRKKYSGIRIISDSRISVEGLRSWIYSWVQNAKDGVLMSSSGLPVANQQLFLYTFYSIYYSLPRCSICHIDGHRRSYNDADVIKTMSNFCKTNKVNIDKETIRSHIDYNNMVDQMTRKCLDKNVIFTRPMSNVNGIQLINVIPTPEELEIYKRATVTF